MWEFHVYESTSLSAVKDNIKSDWHLIHHEITIFFSRPFIKRQLNLLYCKVCDIVLSKKVMLEQFYCSFLINFILSHGNSEIIILLCTSILSCKILLIAFFEKKIATPIFG